MASKQENKGCGCSNIPISIILLLLGLGYWGSRQVEWQNLTRTLTNALPSNVAEALPWSEEENTAPTAAAPSMAPTQPPATASAEEVKTEVETSTPATTPPEPAKAPTAPQPADSAWKQKQLRGIYLSRYQVTNNASEKMIRDRVRYYKSQGINTIIHGVWGNGCTMYNSDVMQQTFGMASCPNLFQAPWLDWLIDEAHKQGMEVHAYFEKGIKLDENSPIFDQAIRQRWIVPGVDKTYPSVDHYVLDVENPEMSKFFKQVLAEFVTKYPAIDAVQWDDYLGYHDALPGKVDRTAQLTEFVTQLKTDMKAANPNVSFDLCHHNPYWGKQYFAADWEKWNVDRAFIQVYNDDNFNEELPYVEQYGGVSIADNQLHRLQALIDNPKVKNILVFPAKGNPEAAAKALNAAVSE
ncbi:MAG: family 10 glycosylhydrolase [Cyanobacteria bacterium J06642_11]